MECQRCEQENLIDSKYCGECGHPLSDNVITPFKSEDNNEDIMTKVKEIGEILKKSITEKNYKEILFDRKNPVTSLLIVFVAWLVLRTVGAIPIVILVGVISFLMGYAGLLFLLAVTYVYTNHKPAIDQKIEEMKDTDYKKTLKEMMDETLEKLKDKKTQENSEEEEKIQKDI